VERQAETLGLTSRLRPPTLDDDKYEDYTKGGCTKITASGICRRRPIADILRRERFVRFGPNADIMRCSKSIRAYAVKSSPVRLNAPFCNFQLIQARSSENWPCEAMSITLRILARHESSLWLQQRRPYSAGCGSRAFSTPLTRIAIAIAATRKPIATIAVTPRTRPNPLRP
jgi:hypothetical protein